MRFTIFFSVMVGLLVIAPTTSQAQTCSISVTNPANTTVDMGETAFFSVTATQQGSGSPKFQWFKNNKAVSGATGANFSFVTTCEDDNAQIHVVATSGCSNSVKATSAKATLDVLVPAHIHEDPKHTEAESCGSATFSAVVKGDPTIKYQWQIAGPLDSDREPVDADFEDIPGATGPTLVLKDIDMYDDRTYVRLYVENQYGSDYSNPAKLTVTPSCKCDTDLDLQKDKQEVFDGTNNRDGGSFKNRLISPVYSKYNTFLNQYAILELMGIAGVDIVVTVYDSQGKFIISQTIPLAPGQQYDLLVHDLVAKDTYGLIRIDFVANGMTAPATPPIINPIEIPDIDDLFRSVREEEKECDPQLFSGRMVAYRPNGNGEYSFAFARELRNGTHKSTFAGGNSFDPVAGGNLTPNWAEIVNPSTKPLKMTHKIYNAAGGLVSTNKFTVPPLGEVNVQAGHEFGESVYLNEFIPDSDKVAYLASVARYNSRADGNYNFAFALDARRGSHDRVMSQMVAKSDTSLDKCFRPSNWIEVTNTASDEETGKPKVLEFEAAFYTHKGDLIGKTPYTLAARAQQHIDGSQILSQVPIDDELESHQVGIVELNTKDGEGLVAQSLVYYHNLCEGPPLLTAYASHARVGLLKGITNSYNTFLGLENQVNFVASKRRDYLETDVKQFTTQLLNVTSFGRLVSQQFYLPGSTATTESLIPTFANPDSYGTFDSGPQATTERSLRAGPTVEELEAAYPHLHPDANKSIRHVVDNVRILYKPVNGRIRNQRVPDFAMVTMGN